MNKIDEYKNIKFQNEFLRAQVRAYAAKISQQNSEIIALKSLVSDMNKRKNSKKLKAVSCGN